MKTVKVYVVGLALGYSSFINNRNNVSTMEEADLVLFTGGEDVDPSLYKERVGYQTGINPMRDLSEIKEWEKAVALGKPILGICRGSQFSCVMSGGQLVQHMAHPYYHKLETIDGEELNVNSLHHQMQYPFSIPKPDYILIAASYDLSPVYLNGDDVKKTMPTDVNNRVIEPEVVYYKKTKALGIQSHPEMMSDNTNSNKYFNKLVHLLISEDNLIEDLSIKGTTVDGLMSQVINKETV